mgnify:CR=1 FL=1
MGPSVPMSAVRAAPIRRMAAEVMNTGSTVENTAMPTACRYTGAGCASACRGWLTAKCSKVATVDTSIASAVKRAAPSSRITGSLPAW